MANFNKIIMITILATVFMIAGANALMIKSRTNIDKYHLVEINRAYDYMIHNGVFDNVDEYEYIETISFLPLNSSPDEMKVFLESVNDAYVIKATDDGYIKFVYQTDKPDDFELFFIINICLITISISIILFLFYLKNQIIKPFNQVSEMPYALSKGHPVQGIQENKARFFGRFIWGLDMLRETLEQRKKQELALIKERKTLILSISHDIKTPLSAIKLYSKALNDDLYNDVMKNRDIAGKINENAEKIEAFVNDIVIASKEDFLNIELTNKEFYLNDLIGQLSAYYQDKLSLSKTSFVVSSFDNCLIHGDLERCLEAFHNIIENACKYGDGKNIAISFEREDGCQLVTVSNSGNRLPENETVHIFDSFWRGSNTKDKQGSGLGLYISRQILVKMKGDIFAEASGDKMKITVVLKII